MYKKILFILIVFLLSSCAKQYGYDRVPRVANPRVLKEESIANKRAVSRKKFSYDDEFVYEGESLSKIDISKIEEKERVLSGQRHQSFKDDGSVKIAILLPMSGKAEKIGIALKNSIEMAYYDINNSNLELSFYDTKGDAIIAREKAENAVEDGADIFLGPLFSECVEAVSEVASRRNRYVISFTTDNSVLEDKTYSINYLKSQEMERMMAFISTQGYYDTVFLLPKGSLGEILEKVIEDKSSRYNINSEIVFFDEKNQKELNEMVKSISDFPTREKNLKDIETEVLAKFNECVGLGYKIDEEGKYDKKIEISISDLELNGIESCKKYEDLKLALEKQTSLGKMEKDAIFIAGNNSSIISIGAFLAYYDVDSSETKLLGLSNFENKKIGSERIFRGSFYSSHNSTLDASFKAKYKRLYSEDPLSIAQTSYDAMYLISSSEDRGRINEDYMLSTSGFLGTSGLFKLKDDGHVERGLAIKKVINSRRNIIISKSPKSFQEYYNNIYKDVSPEESSKDAIKEYEKMQALGYFSSPRSVEEIKENLLFLNPENLNDLIIKQ